MMELKHFSCKLIFVSLLFVFLVRSVTTSAQPISQETKRAVLYDPLVWEHELKLNAYQREKIQKINLEFYQSIYKTVSEGTRDRSYLQSKANQYLQQRSQEIWDAFNPNQRRKWKRLWDHYST